MQKRDFGTTVKSGLNKPQSKHMFVRAIHKTFNFWAMGVFGLYSCYSVIAYFFVLTEIQKTLKWKEGVLFEWSDWTSSGWFMKGIWLNVLLNYIIGCVCVALYILYEVFKSMAVTAGCMKSDLEYV